jgi:hypothetical protein
MSGHLQSPGGLRTLIFDSVKTNQGSGYNSHLGVFRVPRSGIYFFSWTMNLYYSSEHSTELVVNTQIEHSVYLHTPREDRNSATGNIALRVNEGDEVFIRTRADGNGGQIISDAYSRTCFCGFLIE